jgi:DsbC/DsbD-like thiol-disulfide interchange protein
MKPLIPLALPLALAASLLALPATAQDMGGIVTLDVLPGWDTADGTRMVGLRLTLAEGWKTYWRAPGDGGIPPQVLWSGSENIAGAQFHWPVPEVFTVAGVRSIGYGGQVVIPVELQPATPGQPARAAGELDIGVCEDVCVPMRLSFDVTLPPGGGRDPAIVAALVDRPLTGAEAGAGPVTCALTPGDHGLTITATIPLGDTGGTEVVVIETSDPQVWVSEADVTRQGQTLTAEADLIHSSGGGFALDRSGVRITVLGRDRAVDLQGCTGQG